VVVVVVVGEGGGRGRAGRRCRFGKLNPTYLSGSERLPIRRAVVNMEVNRRPEAPLDAKGSLNPS